MAEDVLHTAGAPRAHQPGRVVVPRLIACACLGAALASGLSFLFADFVIR